MIGDKNLAIEGLNNSSPWAIDYLLHIYQHVLVTYFYTPDVSVLLVRVWSSPGGDDSLVHVALHADAGEGVPPAQHRHPLIICNTSGGGLLTGWRHICDW